MIESFGYMAEALVLAVILVYMILAAQFNSFIQPITIMVSLPLSVIGAFGALGMLNMTLSILLHDWHYHADGVSHGKCHIDRSDFTDQARERGMAMREALFRRQPTLAPNSYDDRVLTAGHVARRSCPR